ncbi:hypothetical protein RCS94_08745 [Orbaceae bacterium ac157xtp]
MIAPSSYGALSATSANTIKGKTPWFTGQSGAKKLGFKIGNTTYSESENNLSSAPSEINYFNAGLRLDEFEVTNFTAADFSLTADYYDADGDASYSTAIDTFSMDPRTFVWKDSTDAIIPTADYNKTLGCGSNLNLPLSLEITLPKVKVRSRYGNPRESLETNLVQTYKIGTASGICFAKPNQMIVNPSHTWVGTNGASSSSYYWNNTYYKNRNPTNGGGYDSNQFDPVNGFKASADPKFPTTGFPKASFTLIMVGNASNYTFSVLKPDGSLLTDGSVTVGTDGKVTLNSKPTEPVTIIATFNSDPNQVHRYTFDPRAVWVVPKLAPVVNGYSGYIYTSAKTACGDESKIPTRAQLTNSPLSNLDVGGTVPSNTYTRAVGGGVFGEWGVTGSSTYPGSQWINSWYWTREPSPYSNYQFVVDTYDGGGRVDNLSPNYLLSVACLE